MSGTLSSVYSIVTDATGSCCALELHKNYKVTVEKYDKDNITQKWVLKCIDAASSRYTAMQSLEGTDVYLHGGIGGNHEVRGVIGGGQRWWIQHFPDSPQYMICIPRTQTPKWSAVSIGEAPKVGDTPITGNLDSDAPWGSASQQWRFEPRQ